MASRKRRHFPESFGRQAVEHVRTSGLPVRRMAEDLVVHDLAAANARLKRELQYTQMERDMPPKRPRSPALSNQRCSRARSSGRPAGDLPIRRRASQHLAGSGAPTLIATAPNQVWLAELPYNRAGEGWRSRGLSGFVGATGRARPPSGLRHRCRGAEGLVRLHRGLIHVMPSALRDRPLFPGRQGAHGGLTPSTSSGQDNARSRRRPLVGGRAGAWTRAFNIA